ncbi:TRAP transporter small permease [Geminicoccus harenae]|uniref:TRAP transporter small permease n=1 Tax=Geminicoccus harenae TaxID=2498453 RepID=UPI00168BF239|nr:TRAP transporter small permease [Geminicoccus harenae]
MLKLAAGLTWLVRIALFVSAMLGLVMSLLVFSAVFMRYMLASPLHFSDELVALLFSACVFLTIPYTFAMNLSIRVTLIADHLSERARTIADALSNLGCIGFFLIFGYLSYEFTSFSLLIDARSDVARLPVAPWMALMPISSFLTALIVVGKWILASRAIQLGTDEERRVGEVV